LRKILSENSGEPSVKKSRAMVGREAPWIAILAKRALFSQNFIAARRFFPPLFCRQKSGKLKLVS